MMNNFFILMKPSTEFFILGSVVLLFSYAALDEAVLNFAMIQASGYAAILFSYYLKK